MSLLVQPRLVNRPEGDPGVYLDFRFGRRAMLFDLGDPAPLSPRELLRVSHAFVSHAHMDHVAGFDPLLRLRLHRPRPLTVVGPVGFVAQVESRLGAFTWNLLDDSSVDFRLEVLEFDSGRITRAAEFRAREGFRRRDLPPPDLPDGLVLDEENLTVEAVVLDHGIPSLAFALQEGLRVNVWRSALDELGLPVGPWLEDAKRAARLNLPDEHAVAVPGHGDVRLGLLRERVLRIERGQRVTYVTDAADTVENRDRIVRLAAGSDDLFIETAFLARDRALAEATAHLTARTAGELARKAGARRVTGFHVSARYFDDPGVIEQELEAALTGAPPAAPVEPSAARDRAGDEPGWLRRWRRYGAGERAALARFESLPAVEPAQMLGDWRGADLDTGHPLDGLLEALGWHGKRFESEDNVHPLVFSAPRGEVAINPSWVPARLLLRWPALRGRPVRGAFPVLRLLLQTGKPAARLRRVAYRGTPSAAMVYDRQPIIDHFRRIDPARVLGLMDMRDAPPFFFLLYREGEAGNGSTG